MTPRLQEAASVSDFLAEPFGRYYAGRRHCVFARSPTLIGFASWGRPDVNDVRELLTLCEIGLKPGIPRHRFLVDVRHLELVEPATFGLFVDYVRTHREALRRNVERQAQLRPDGLVGAIIAGFSQLARLSYPERVFGDVEEALAWLGVDHAEGVDLLAEIAAIRERASATHEAVSRLRRELDAAGAVSIEEAARRLGLSMRTLQRALRQAGTTYRDELRSFRIRRAQELLRRGEQSLTWIALELGFSSTQHFATAFRRALGEPPSAWRARHRDRD